MPTSFDVYDLADALLERNQALPTKEAIRVARACLWHTSRANLNGNDRCQTLPIFASGSDVPQATHHDLEALSGWPLWVALNYRPASETPGDRLWMNAEPECQDRDPGVTSCDEYPFWATMQGGPAAGRRPHLKLIDFFDNRDQGLRYANFIVNCHMATSGAFLAIPLAPQLGIPTQTRICNGH